MSVGSGTSALAARPRTLPGVSAPSRVVRSIIEMALSIAQALLVVLIERVPSAAARASQPTWSTPGRPCSQLVRARLVRRDTPTSSRARSMGSTTVAVLTGRVYGRGQAWALSSGEHPTTYRAHCPRSTPVEDWAASPPVVGRGELAGREQRTLRVADHGLPGPGGGAGAHHAAAER